MNKHKIYIQRCLQLAALGMGYVAPNPMVGSVLVYNDIIIGEGWHKQYGEAHAEVNCIKSVKDEHKSLIPLSTLYVSLEPCNHFGKTPPCSHLIVEQGIKKVVVGCKDSFKLVNGSGIQFLRQHGVEVIENVLEQECKELNKRFFYFHQYQKPFVLLKWAATNNGFIGNNNNERLLISNELSQKLVHQFRSNEAAILVGANTIIKDNPQLNNRFFGIKQPIKLVIANNTILLENTSIFNYATTTIIFTKQPQFSSNSNIEFVQLNNNTTVVQQVMEYCFLNNIQSVLVEGGASTLQYFIDENCWNEAAVITNNTLNINDGVKAPELKNNVFIKKIQLHNDCIQFFKNNFSA
jgi:diaminohydroxyphosphoribosylaminopyrimidine deaminase / 5-amino-6-(5-phosphoribosylamino)uracil reductase